MHIKESRKIGLFGSVFLFQKIFEILRTLHI